MMALLHWQDRCAFLEDDLVRQSDQAHRWIAFGQPMTGYSRDRKYNSRQSQRPNVRDCMMPGSLFAVVG